ncbi:efflux RND transporter periplasmic adaptor subunit [Shewanella maritima]|uniref:efflux RND transporter periplasmic adaptor subunit n=1 Tax=Shewanella maritima TaxID=2520507 RepID=UPI003735498F
MDFRLKFITMTLPRTFMPVKYSPLTVVVTSFMLIFSLSVSADSDEQALATLTVQPHFKQHDLTIDGIIEPIKAATVSAQTSGRIITVNYDVNDEVLAGSPLLEITSDEQTAEFNAAQANLAQAIARNNEAQATLSRFKALFPQGAISQGQMDEATANASSTEQAVTAAQAQLNKAKQSLNYTVVSAPFKGRVTQRFIEQGETITYGQPLFSGYSTENLRATFSIAPQFLVAAKQADTFTLTLANGEQLTSHDIQVFDFADPQSQQHQVRVNFNHPQGYAGQWVKGQFTVSETKGFILPMSALVRRHQLDGVYRKVGSNYLLTQVRVTNVDKHNNTFEVQSGVMAGDEIIINADTFIISGAHQLASQGED